MAAPICSPRFPWLPLMLVFLIGGRVAPSEFEIDEATIETIHLAFARNELTARRLTELYLARIRELNPSLRAVIEVNPAALSEADAALSNFGPLRGVPVLLKDNIATAPPLNTTAGSAALLGAATLGDASTAARLRNAGAVILGKASLSEWAHFRSFSAPDGWSALGGQGVNPYNPLATPCGSSSGSAIAVAANLVAVALGTETDGSILCPAAAQSLVGIKPTVGLTSRAGVIPISPRQDTVGPIARTVADAVRVLDVISGYDSMDSVATAAALKFIPPGGYLQFLRPEGLKGKRLGILRKPFFEFPDSSSAIAAAFEAHLYTLRKEGAIIVDDLEIANTSVIVDAAQSGEAVAILAEFKIAVNAYLTALPSSPVRSLADVIAFNEANPVEERTVEYGQELFLLSQATEGIGDTEREALANLERLSEAGIETLMREERLDAVVMPEMTAAMQLAAGSESGGVPSFWPVLAIGGYPGIVVPAGFDDRGVPFGICFGGLRWSEPALIEIAYGFEQATKIRRPPVLLGMDERPRSSLERASK